jgi:hypothetical protein
MSDTTFRRPKGTDMQSAIAFIAALERGDDAVEKLWDAAAEEGRGFMLACALGTCARHPEMMAEVLSGDQAARAVKLANVAEMIATMSYQEDDD